MKKRSLHRESAKWLQADISIHADHLRKEPDLESFAQKIRERLDQPWHIDYGHLESGRDFVHFYVGAMANSASVRDISEGDFFSTVCTAVSDYIDEIFLDESASSQDYVDAFVRVGNYFCAHLH